MQRSAAVRAAIIVGFASRTATAQWCEVLTAKPYSKNMPGITEVVIGSMRRSSASIENAQNSYVVARDTLTLAAGEAYTIAITHSRDSVAFPRAANNLRVWVDYDRDGAFTGAQELVVAADGVVPGTTTFSFTVPAKITPVAGTRMRVTAKMSAQAGHSPPTPCDDPRDGFGYHGEIEDYPVNIAKSPDPVIETRAFEPELVRQFDRIAGLLVRLVEKMPEESFGFRPTPEARAFVAAVGHVAAANVNICSNLLQRRHALSGTNLEVSLRTKTEAVAALKDSFSFCSEYASALKTGGIGDRFFEVRTRGRDGKPLLVRTPHASLVTNLIAHGNEMYGYLAVYLRLKGIVPPSSEG